MTIFKQAIFVSAAVFSAGVFAQDVRITTTPVSASVYMLQGQGGNIGVSAGEDGVFMIDDQFAPLSEKISAAVAEISDKPIRFILNTHWHFDHTGGNENFGKAGTLIVAHENVRERMSTEQVMKALDRTVPASPKVALPVVTFNDRSSFFINGDEIRAIHIPNAHTDGDSIIHFRVANVIHMGDTFFNGLYPFIDLGSGGSVQGMIAYKELLQSVTERVATLMRSGATLQQIIAAKPSAKYDAKWGGKFIATDKFIGFIFDSLKNPPAAYAQSDVTTSHPELHGEKHTHSH